jgi:asparagine synthase (glutamine-hydrolysing)
MCGISGEFSFRTDGDPLEAVRTMTAQMAPRGPDAAGIHQQSGIAFGHRRLRVIDLSERAQQPMVDSGLGLAIVFNGTIYNYRDLRRELEQRGYCFFSRGDTEVVLKAYHAWGASCVDRFNGMFAFAIWHRDETRLFLARDRLGIKPLYYNATADRFRFASTLPALLAAGGVDTDIDPVALHRYMTFHAVVPAPRTLLKGVRKLEPGCTMEIDSDGTARSSRYWSLSFQPGPEELRYSQDQWEERLGDELQRAVRRRLVADVPVGVLLSGGLDSSLLVALLSQAGQDGLQTFSIGFEEVNGETGNEFTYSDRVANHFGTDHHKIEVQSSGLLSCLDECVLAMSEPMVSHDCIGFYLLGQRVSRHVKVVQSGQGADEVFAGYRWYPPLMDAVDPVSAYAEVFFDRRHEEYERSVFPDYAGADHSTHFVRENFALPGAGSPIDKALRLDTTVMLVDDPVKRVDNMTMAWGLEARVPFLDHELVELAARIPAHLKVNGGGKHILKKLGRKLLPAEVIDRPKGYFPVPALKHFRGPYLEKARSILDSPASINRRLWDPSYVALLLDDPDAHLTPLRGSKLWQIVLLEYWLQSHGIL